MKQKKLSPDRNKLKTLIESIGGESALHRILLCFYTRMKGDAMIGYFFEGKPIAEIARKQGEFILMAAGLLRKFEGRGPATAHTNLPPIYEGHFDRRLVLLRETLQAEGVHPPEIETWVRFEESFRAMVVQTNGMDSPCF
ncbi:MAG: group 1 truncated hemoglobin [Bdellovibrionales bacterium]|nr:group 1 truncated hemoglobin [Bdellovibrionales bacterium]